MKHTILILLLLPIMGFAYQPRPIEFWLNDQDEAFGTLEDGTTFSQTNVATDLGIRLQRFQWAEGYWYVSDKGIIEAESDLQAFSIYLTM